MSTFDYSFIALIAFFVLVGVLAGVSRLCMLAYDTGMEEGMENERKRWIKAAFSEGKIQVDDVTYRVEPSGRWLDHKVELLRMMEIEAQDQKNGLFREGT